MTDVTVIITAWIQQLYSRQIVVLADVIHVYRCDRVGHYSED